MAKRMIKMNSITNKNIDDAFKDFIKYCRVKNLSNATTQYYEDCFYKFKEYYQGELKDITTKIVDDYVLHLRGTNITDISVNTYLRGLRVILYYFMGLGYMEEFKITIHKADKKIKETYTDKELEILLKKPNLKQCDFVEYRTWVIVNFLLGTGCRSNTLCNIKVKDLNIESEIVILSTTKNKKQQIIPISNQLSIIIQEYLTYRQPSTDEDYLFISVYGEQLNSNSLRHSVVRYNQRRGIMKTGIHLFRHTFAKKWIQNQGNIFSLQKILGHSSLEMVKEYVNLYSDDIRSDYDKYNPLKDFTNTNYISMRRSKSEFKGGGVQ